MNIVSVKNNQDHHEYLLKEDDKTVLKLVYKNDMHIARIETEKEKRVLLIEDEGLLRTLLVLKNEYGVRIGSLNYDNFSGTHGTVDIESIKYRFNVSQDASTELKIYKGSRKNLIYSCQLPVQDKNSKAATASLIIAVSWYLFLSEERKLHHTFNEAIIL
jgi:hypothetical protein